MSARGTGLLEVVPAGSGVSEIAVYLVLMMARLQPEIRSCDWNQRAYPMLERFYE